VFQLRTPEDANQIAEKANGKNVVIIGSSFIGLYDAMCINIYPLVKIKRL
jgi:hypothetical protein